MATVKLDKEIKVITLKCDCGAIHYIDLSQSKIQVKSEFQKIKEEKNEKEERKRATTIFDELFENESDESDESNE